MRTVLVGLSMSVAVLFGATAVAATDSDTQGMVLRLKQILGVNWTVTSRGPTIDAYRVPRQLPVEHFDARIDAEKRALQLRESRTTVDFAEGNIRLAGSANDCDDVGVVITSGVAPAWWSALSKLSVQAERFERDTRRTLSSRRDCRSCRRRLAERLRMR